MKDIVTKNKGYKKILKYAIYSRVFIWIVALLSQSLVSDLDSSTSTVLFYDSKKDSIFDLLAIRLFGPFMKWDSFYFIHIAEKGYVFEQENAFFPLLPCLMRIVSNSILYPLQYILNFRNVLLISGVLISNISFVLATLSIYRLGIKIFKNENFSRIAAICYCLTPSGIFSSAIYTESLFAFLTFFGMEKLYDKKYFYSAIIWMLATLTRSNAITYIGFYGYELIKSKSFKYLVSPILKKINNNYSLKEKANEKNKEKISFLNCVIKLCFETIKFIVLSLIVISGLVAFQYYGYKQFCQDVKDENGNMIRPWCNQPLPLLYTYVQNQYWNCGFLKYYEFKQIPNFIIAAPIIIISLCGIWSYCSYNWKRILTIGLLENDDENNNNSTAETVKKIQTPYYTNTLIPYIVLWTFLLAYCCTSMHIQVITRFFSSVPTLYWFVAWLIYNRNKMLKKKEKNEDGDENNKTNNDGKENKKINWGYLIINYFVFYSLIGVVLFTAFYPPA